jgi:hypothetical protein
LISYGRSNEIFSPRPTDIPTARPDHVKLRARSKRPRRRAAKRRDERAADSFNDLVGGSEQLRRHVKAKRLRGFEVDNQLELGRLLNRDIARFRPVQNLINIISCTPKLVGGCLLRRIMRPAASTYSRRPCIVGSRAPSASVLIRTRLAPASGSATT